MNILFDQRLKEITQEHETLLKRKNEPIIPGNGIYTRYNCHAHSFDVEI